LIFKTVTTKIAPKKKITLTNNIVTNSYTKFADYKAEPEDGQTNPSLYNTGHLSFTANNSKIFNNEAINTL